MRNYLLLYIFLAFSCSNAVKIDKKSKELALQSDTLIINGNYKEAMIIIEKALELDDRNYIAYNNLGYLKDELGYPQEEVLQAFKKSYDLNNNYMIGLYSLTNYYLKLKEYQNAVEFGMTYLNKSESAAVEEKDKAHILGIIGESYNYLNSYENAIKYLTESLKIAPENAGGYKERGTAYRNLGENSNAIVDFNKSIELDSSYHQAFNSRAIYYEDIGESEKALVDYNAAIRLNPNPSTYLLNRALFRYSIGDKNDACKDFLKSDSLGNEKAQDYYIKYCVEK